MKRCSKCRETKDASLFYRARRFADGLTAWCKDCYRASRQTPKARAREAASARRWYRENRERALATRRARSQTEHGRLLAKKYWAETPAALRLFTTAKSRAKKNSIAFDIEVSDIVIPERCPLLGIVLQHGTRRWSALSPSLDRIDPTKGYVKGNVWVISHRANRLKMDATLEELETLVANLREKMRLRAA